jgi:hypothetical protein
MWQLPNNANPHQNYRTAFGQQQLAQRETNHAWLPRIKMPAWLSGLADMPPTSVRWV